jgi:hypothetical protein
MGMLALGLSYIVVPMFAQSQAPSERHALASCALAVLALALIAVAAFGVAAVAMRVVAVAAGALAVAVHLRLMLVALRTGMRRDPGRSFRLVRVGWGMLAASLAAALGVAVNAPFDAMATLFGFLLIVGWLLTFLLGVLQRILPFLASMHAARGRHLPPTPSSLGAGSSLAVHYACHLAALGMLVVAIVADSTWLVRLGALAGCAGSIAFAIFFATVVKRMVEANVGGSHASA